ncbi:MAG: enoyl-CoA hydratase/isomerase family protein [Mycobacterium sp.]|nr:enoyl-CoA hydratase/isomerase family protein [Mycobacterium sp.]
MAVRITNDDAVRVIVLDRPRARNALNTELMAELAAALSEADADHRVRAVVITGSQQTFCAGADLGALDGLTVSDSLAADGFGKRFFGQLHDCRKPTIAAVSGPAYGGGCELVLACDIAIGGQSSKYALPEVGLGLIPGGGGTQRLIRAIGKPKAMQMLLTGDPITADQACTAGLIAEVVPDDQYLTRAVTLGVRIARNGPLAVQLAKDAARTAFESPLSAGLAYERRNFYLSARTQDMREGVDAFRDRRQPIFLGA